MSPLPCHEYYYSVAPPDPTLSHNQCLHPSPRRTQIRPANNPLGSALGKDDGTDGILLAVDDDITELETINDGILGTALGFDDSVEPGSNDGILLGNDNRGHQAKLHHSTPLKTNKP